MPRLILPTVVLALGCSQGSPSAEGPTSWVLVEDLVAGEVGGDLDLANVFDLVPGPDGRIYVTQWQVPTVQVVDQRGHLVAEIGRQGQGPGEFGQPSVMGWLGDTLWVAELGEVEFFSRDGGHLARVSYRETLYPELGISYGPGIPLSSGLMLGTPSYGMRHVRNGDLKRVPILVADRSGAIVDSIGHLDLAGTAVEISFGDGGGGMMGAHPLPPTPGYQVAPDGEYLVRLEIPGEGLFRVTKLTADFDTVYSLDRPFDPVELRDEWISAFIDRQARPVAATLDRPIAVIARGFAEALELDVSPPVRAMVAGADGTVWLKREPLEGVTARWEVLGDDGYVEAVVKLPDDLKLHHASREVAWSVRLGRYDEPLVIRYLVRPDLGGA